MDDTSDRCRFKREDGESWADVVYCGGDRNDILRSSNRHAG